MFRQLSYLLILLTPFVVGCSDPASPERNSTSADSQSVDPGVIRLGYVERPDDIAGAQVVRAVLEESGFGAELVPLVAADLWRAIAVGEVDAMVGARLPVRHAHLYGPVSTAVDNLGYNLKGLRVGLVVPGFVDLASIGDLAGQGERVGGRILGIEADADLMTATRRAIDHYGLSDLELMASATPLMLAMLQTDITAGNWAVATGWTPHWLFAEHDIRFLDDPSGIYGGEEQFVTIARKGLRAAKPDATAVLDRFNWTLADLNRMMLLNRDAGADPAANARQWVLDNLDKVHAWAGRGAVIGDEAQGARR